jgi:hypothetical protein
MMRAEMSNDNVMKQKHYELLGKNVVRYVTSVMVKGSVSEIELGKAIELMTMLVQREAERDSRETFNQQQGVQHDNTHK